MLPEELIGYITIDKGQMGIFIDVIEFNLDAHIMCYYE